MPNDKTVFLTGATGQQGNALGHLLLDRGYKVRALTRKPDHAHAVALQKKGATIVTGGFDDRAVLEQGIKGTDIVFLMGTPYEAGPDTETRQAKTVVDAVRTAGTKHLVYSSVGSADQKTNIPHFESKMRVEEHIARSELPHTIVRPVFFMDNVSSPWWMPGLQKGVLAMAMSPSRKLQQITVPNVAAFLALVIDRGSEFLGKSVDIASDDISGEEAARLISAASGKPIKYVQVPLEELRKQNEDFARMFEFFEERGYRADVEGLRKRYPEVGWTRFADWVKTQDWSSL
jgi:uncharacterized protein YbjT (DUF2867 family)